MAADIDVDMATAIDVDMSANMNNDSPHIFGSISNVTQIF
jgi:hypothetical protein